MAKHKHLLVATLAIVVGVFALARVPNAGAQAVAQGYNSDSTLQIGMVVRLDPKDSSKIVPATQATADKIQGIIVAPNDVTVALSGNGSAQEYYVASSGEYRVLVSDQNGTIHSGDYVVMSSLSGVGMEVDDTQRTVVGKATQDFTGKGDGILSTTKLKDSSGKTHTVHLGYTVVSLNVAANPLQRQAEASGVPGFIKQASESVANKPVSFARAYISLGVLIVSAVIAGSVLYAGVKSGIVAVGRNPLARKSIMRNLLQVIFTSLIVFVVGIFAVYLLLKL